MLNNEWVRCDNSGPNCVEVRLHNEMVEVRDSKDANSPILSFNASEWTAFINGANTGKFNI